MDLRAIGEDEYDAFSKVLQVAFAEAPAPELTDHWRQVLEFDRTVAAFDGDRMVATGGVVTFELTVPGGRIPMGGVTAVGVLPSHRRRGLLRRMMEAMFDDCQERGEPLAGLWASESSIYPRFGYGAAAQQAAVALDTRRAAFTRPVAPPVVDLVEPDGAAEALRPIYDRARDERPGLLDVSPARWAWLGVDPDSEREGASPRVIGVVPDRAYVVYRIKEDWSEGLADHEVRVEALHATDPDAYAAMWRWVLELDLAARVAADGRPVDEPLQLLLTDPRRLRQRVTDSLWLAVLDVPAALTGRRYRVPGVLVIAVTGAAHPGVDGVYRVEAGAGGEATCEHTAADPDLTVPAAALGATYLGGTGFGRLAAAGIVTEHRRGSLRLADAMFGTSPAPWCPFEF